MLSASKGSWLQVSSLWTLLGMRKACRWACHRMRQTAQKPCHRLPAAAPAPACRWHPACGPVDCLLRDMRIQESYLALRRLFPLIGREAWPLSTHSPLANHFCARWVWSDPLIEAARWVAWVCIRSMPLALEVLLQDPDHWFLALVGIFSRLSLPAVAHEEQ